MEDRDCDTRPRNSRSHHRLPKAGTFANPRLPRSNSATGGLPRGRSFQGGKPQTPAAQAAQDGYYHRKAMKMYAEKRKAAATAAAAPKDDATTEEARKPAGLINITVDHNGVKIGDTKPGGNAGGMGSRRNSRSRMSRSSSRRGNARVEDKENSDRPTEAEIDAYFNRKRGEKDVRDTPGENTSWDGSMPKRQNSRSFIERQPRPLDTNVANSGSVKDVATSKPADKRTEQHEEPRQRGRRRGNRKGDAQHKRTGGGDEGAQTAKTTVSTPAKVTEQESKQTSEDDNRVPSMSDVSESDANCTISPQLPQKPETAPITPPKDTESQSSGSSYKSSLSKAASTTSEASSSTDAGKWCDECAGIGLHIAALMSDLKRYRPLTENGAEAPTPSSSSKKGWKSMVTHTMLGGGDSKSKTITEKNRLQNEITVLRATVEFLYKKIETLEKAA